MTQLAIWFTLLIIVALLIIALPILRKQKESNPLVQKSLISALIATPIVALSGYFYLGTPQFAEMQANPEPPKIVSLADGLYEKLKKNPDDLKGWLLLGRSFMIEERTDEAIMAFEKVLSLSPNSFDALLPLADALAVKANGQLQGRPQQLLEQAYAINPDDKMVLWLLGMAEKQQNQPDKAKNHWLKLYNSLEQDDSDRPIIAKLLKSVGYGGAVELVSTQSPTPAEKKTSNSLELDDNTVVFKLKNLATLQAKHPNATVFLYTKAIKGLPMPISAKRLPLAELKEEMRLTAQDLIMANRKLTDETKFITGIRITSHQNINMEKDIFKYEKQSNHQELIEIDLEIIY